MPELYEIVNKYHPEVIWSDGSEGNASYWKSTEFIAWLYNESPVKDTVVTNDRWGSPASCKHGDFYTCHDRYNPKTLQKHKWENCFTLDKHSWGLRREAQVADYLTIHDIITTIAETVRYSIEFHSYSYERLKQNAL
jgi:alpha-L-fucosidase